MSSINLKYIKGEITAHEYLDSVLGDCDLSEISTGCEGLAKEIFSTINAAFWKLNELDRNDLFWVPENGLPTISKLDEFSKRQIKLGVDTGFWSWVEICISYFYFANFLYPNLWGAIEKVNVRWLVRTSWNYHHYSGSESSGSLAAVIRSLGMESEAEEELNELANFSIESEIWVIDVKTSLCKP
ncbi:hypothetical protein TDB9533_02844 [Thalassocella blandensis]|nr:hypothetical protein TDB9533_02844 [Thalassocella blandensis]